MAVKNKETMGHFGTGRYAEGMEDILLVRAMSDRHGRPLKVTRLGTFGIVGDDGIEHLVAWKRTERAVETSPRQVDAKLQVPQPMSKYARSLFNSCFAKWDNVPKYGEEGSNGNTLA